MTVRLEFVEDIEQIRDAAITYLDPGPGELGSAPLSVTWFIHETHFWVEEVDIFDQGRWGAGRVAILGLAMDLSRDFKRAWIEGNAASAIFGIDDMLQISREGEQLRVQMPYGPSGVAPAHILGLAASTFANQVREYILKYIPALADDELLGEWFRTADQPPQFQTD